MRACRRERKREAVTCARVICVICKGVEEIRIGIRIEGDSCRLLLELMRLKIPLEIVRR